MILIFLARLLEILVKWHNTRGASSKRGFSKCLRGIAQGSLIFSTSSTFLCSVIDTIVFTKFTCILLTAAGPVFMAQEAERAVYALCFIVTS